MIGTACPRTHVGCAGLSPMLPLAASILISPQAVVGSQVGCCLKGHLKKILWEPQWLPQTTWSTGLRPSFHPHVRLPIVLTSEYHVLEFDASPLSNSVFSCSHWVKMPFQTILSWSTFQFTSLQYIVSSTIGMQNHVTRPQKGITSIDKFTSLVHHGTSTILMCLWSKF